METRGIRRPEGLPPFSAVAGLAQPSASWWGAASRQASSRCGTS